MLIVGLVEHLGEFVSVLFVRSVNAFLKVSIFFSNVKALVSFLKRTG